jgi:4-hydroxy-tetrahydrodipicolinate synthase
VGNQMQAMIKAFVSGNRTEARRIEAELMPIFEVLFITSNPTPLKAALRLQGFNVGIPRLPLVAATDTEIAQIREALIPWT